MSKTSKTPPTGVYLSFPEIIQGLRASRFPPGASIRGDTYEIVILTPDRFQIAFNGQPPETWCALRRAHQAGVKKT